MPEIAIIGGTGIYNPDTFETIEEVFPDTPYGKPSDPILVGRINGVEVAFLYRHGKRHQYPPTNVPYRANMWALKELGCKYIISACAVGSLQEQFVPGDLVIADQFIDFTKRRDYTYFDDSAVHISIPDPFCPYLNRPRRRWASGTTKAGHTCASRAPGSPPGPRATCSGSSPTSSA